MGSTTGKAASGIRLSAPALAGTSFAFTSDLPTGDIDNTDTRVGFNVGGGVEYFLNRTVAVKGEGRYHAIEDARGEEPSGTALTIGLKTYF